MKYIFEKIKTLAIFSLLYIGVMVWGIWSMGFFRKLDAFPRHVMDPLGGSINEIAYLEPVYLLAVVTATPVLFVAYRHRLALKRPAGYVLVVGALLSYLLLPLLIIDATRYDWRPPVYTTNYDDFANAAYRALVDARVKDTGVQPPPPSEPAPVVIESTIDILEIERRCSQGNTIYCKLKSFGPKEGIDEILFIENINVDIDYFHSQLCKEGNEDVCEAIVNKSLCGELNPKYCYLAAEEFYRGEVVIMDKPKAKLLYDVACDGGYKLACEKLGK